jgi:hypothetical protein
MSLPLVARPVLLAGAFFPLALLLAPKPEPAAAAEPPQQRMSAADADQFIINEIKTHSQLMKNLQYLSDVIGPRLTGSKNVERANNWTAEKMKEYGLENVRLEPWEIPVGWERGKASMRLVEPDTGVQIPIAATPWTPGTNGKVTGEVVVVSARTKADLEKYKGKLKNAVVLTSPPARVQAVSDLFGGGAGGRPEPKRPEPKKEEAKKDDAKKEEPKKGRFGGGGGGGFQPGFGLNINEFLKAEGAACVCSDSGKPQGLLMTGGRWPADRAAGEAALPRVSMAHESYAMLYRLASRENAVTKVEVEIENRFIPGPVTVYNTVGEVRGSEKPDEIVVVGAHLDSWDLGNGSIDNGTGSCVVLEAARTIAALAKAGSPPKRTIRFCLYTGEEQGLVGSRKYVERHKDELPKHSAAIVHDTGTGKVTGFGVLGRESCKKILDEELVALKKVEGWTGLTMGGLRGGTDHWSYHQAGVPGFACNQDREEYYLSHHTQTDTFDKAKEPNLIQGAQVMSVTAVRIANLPDLLPRDEPKKGE